MRVGIFIINKFIKNYEIEELSNLINSKHEITYIFSEKKNINQHNKYLNFIKNVFLNNFFYLIYLERKFAQLINNKKSYLTKLKELEKKIDIFEKFDFLRKKNIYSFVSIKISKSKYGFDEFMFKKIKDNCDILIFFGYNKIIDKNFLNITEHGILSFHTADINKYKGRPSAFYEFLNNEKKGGITLQKLTSDIDGGKIIEQRSVDISTCSSFDETLYRMMTLKKDLVISGLTKIENNVVFKDADKNVKLSLNKESRKFKNVFKCLKKNILNRYK